MSKEEAMVYVLAQIADKLTKPSDMELLAQQSQRLKQMMKEEDAVSNTIIEEYLARVALLSDSELPHGALTEGVRDHPGLGEDGIAVIQAAEAKNQAVMDEISVAYREHYNLPAQLTSTSGKPKYTTLPKLPAGILPTRLLNK